MSSASATRTTPASSVYGSPRRRWPMIALQRLGDDHGALRLVVDLLQKLPQLRLGEEQAVGLVIGAVDGHADVVQERPGGDHDLARRGGPSRGR